MSGHTPGPWRMEVAALLRDVPKFGEDDMIAAVIGASEADQKLIAAAPDLLAASADFLKWFETFIGKPTMSEIECSELTALRAAIAKATHV
jgi:hypothetical protein